MKLFNFEKGEESADNALLYLIQRCGEKHEDFILNILIRHQKDHESNSRISVDDRFIVGDRPYADT